MTLLNAISTALLDSLMYGEQKPEDLIGEKRPVKQIIKAGGTFSVSFPALLSVPAVSIKR